MIVYKTDAEIRAMGGAAGTIEFGMSGGLAESASGVLERKFGAASSSHPALRSPRD